MLPVVILLISGRGIDPNVDLVAVGSLVVVIVMDSLYLYLRIAKGFFTRDIIGTVAIALTL